MLLFIVRSMPFKVFSVCKAFWYVYARNVPSFRFFQKYFCSKESKEKKNSFSIYILAFWGGERLRLRIRTNESQHGQRNEFQSAYASCYTFIAVVIVHNNGIVTFRFRAWLSVTGESRKHDFLFSFRVERSFHFIIYQLVESVRLQQCVTMAWCIAY